MNVGCVPKKICHYASLLGHSVHDAKNMGWNVTTNHNFNWEKLTETVVDHIKMLNFRYRVGLKNKDVTYINALASFVDAHTVAYKGTGKDAGDKRITAKYIIIAVGGRPYIPRDIPNAVENAITSDDIFTLNRSPGKTLCVGGSYISLECAGFLTGLGYDVTVCVRSVLLRGFDRQCAEKIGQLMVDLGTKFIYNSTPSEITKLPSGKYQVLITDASGAEKVEVFDTVLFATGRMPDLASLQLDNAGVTVNPTNGKIPVVNEATNIANIFAIGDVCEGKQELTPVAIKAGQLLSRRLFSNSTLQMDYNLIATTVFTPFEYGCIGDSEEDAIAKYGEEDVEIYLSEFTTLELSAVHRVKHISHGEDEDMNPCCFSKLITVRSMNEKVVGVHFVGPNAGEVVQGFALGIKLGATKDDFNNLVGIHPTDAESFCSMDITKRSGQSYVGAGCGGGVCG